MPRGQRAPLDSDMPLLIDQFACLVEPVVVELLAPPVLVLSPQQARPTPRPVAAHETHREASLSKVCSSELLTLSCSCRLDALARLTELTELTALMPSSGQSRSTCASSCCLTATLSDFCEEVGVVKRAHLLSGEVRSVATVLKVVEEVQEEVQEIEDE